MNISAVSIEQIAIEAGQAILEVYNNEKLFAQIDTKADDSPLTLADQRSHNVIMKRLKDLHPEIPIISEEGKHLPYEDRKDYELFWLVDPLDGTKEFIRRNGEFTVNIALIDGKYPIGGVIYVPVTNVLYSAFNGKAYKTENGITQQIEVSRSKENRIAVRSRSHASEEEESVLKSYHVSQDISRGSSLKFCAVAEGSADLYYRHGPTMEWDTAAGQAILEAAGGRIYRENMENERFYYNKENLLNPGFLCLGF